MKTVQREVAEILDGGILVGHAIHNDLKVCRIEPLNPPAVPPKIAFSACHSLTPVIPLQILFLTHPKKSIRDTQKYKPFKTIAKVSKPKCKMFTCSGHVL